MTSTRAIAALAGALALGACGSGGSSTSGSGGTSGTAITGEAAREFSSDLARAERLSDLNATLAPTRPDTLPGGTAEFDGQAAMAFGTAPADFATADLVGDVDLIADFRAGTVTGWLDDFNTRDGRAVRGDLDILGGQISGSDFTGRIDGTLTGPAVAPGNVSGSIAGSFLGSGATAAAGTGTATGASGPATILFTAEREFD